MKNFADEQKVESLRRSLHDAGLNDANDDQIRWCLNSKHANGNAERAHQFLVIVSESLSGVIYPFDSRIKLLGADNTSVTCWLDSFLCALFTVPTQFQDLLSIYYEDPKKQKLIQLIRVWVNLFRKGILIEVAIVGHPFLYLINSLISIRLIKFWIVCVSVVGMDLTGLNNKIPQKPTSRLEIFSIGLCLT